MNRHYYVAYSHSRGTGASEVFLDGPISMWGDVQEVRKRIANLNVGNGIGLNEIVITGWQPLGPEAL